MNTKYAIFTIFLLFAANVYAEREQTPDVESLSKEKTAGEKILEKSKPNEETSSVNQDSDSPEQKPITHQTTVEGEEQVWAVESSARLENIYPSNWGQAGIFRVRSAESLPEGSLTFGIGGEFYSVSNPFGLGSANTIAESLFVGYAPTRQLTLSAMRRNSSTTFGEPQQLISSLGDFNFSAMYSVPLSPSFAIAPIANFLVASNFNNLAPAGTTLSAGFGGAATYSLYDSIRAPVFLHANVLYHSPQIRTSKATNSVEPEMFFNFSRFHTVTLGLGAEIKLGDFIPFLEFWDTVHTNSALGFGRSPSKISVGARITPISNKSLAVLLGTDIATSRGLVAGVPYSPSYQIIGQVSYTVGVTQTERKHYYTTNEVNVVDRKFVIKKNIRFKVGKAELERDSTGLLDQIADVIRQNNVKKLLIVGHTDSTHTEDYNLRLSGDRANAVKRYLVSRGIPEDTLMTQGYGKRKPKASNLTEEGRALNRRVEFFIIE